MPNRQYIGWLVTGLLCAAGGTYLLAQPAPVGLCVSTDGYSLITQTGVPFCWLGDTDWNYFARLSQAKATQYLDDQLAKRFTII